MLSIMTQVEAGESGIEFSFIEAEIDSNVEGDVLSKVTTQSI